MTGPDAAPSRKRVLLAVLLAGGVGFLGLHRFYVGRYLSGAVQLALFTAGAVLMWRDSAGLMNLHSIDEVQNWALTHQIHPLALLLLAVPVFWALGDTIALLAGKFSDRQGNKISRWI